MNVRTEIFIPEKHYETVSKWWLAHNWPVMPLSHLSKLGIISYIDNVPAAAGWLYETDSAFCWFEWIVANPEIRHEKRATALNTLTDAAKEAANLLGFKSIFMSVNNPSLTDRLVKSGFVISDKNMSNLVYNIAGGN